MFKRPLVDIGLFVLKDGRVMLHKRNHTPRVWAFPGGHLEEWESFEECALRELKEEAGDIIVKDIRV